LKLPLYIADTDIDLLKIDVMVIDRLSGENFTEKVEVKVVDTDFYAESDVSSFANNKLNKFNV
jgi:hypothetical protein